MTKGPAEDIFKALDALDHLEAPVADNRKKVPFQSLFSYATDPAFKPDESFKLALTTDLALRRDLKRLLSKNLLCHMDKRAAASSEEITVRQEDSFTLRLIASQSNPDHIYLMLSTEDPQASPVFLFIEEDNGPVYRIAIGDFYDGDGQILLDRQDPVIKALQNHATEVLIV